jgi:C1A family cysteine protease
VVGALEYLLRRRHNNYMDVSRLFIYYNTRRLQMQNSIVQDDGATLSMTLNAIQKYGFCDERLWPYEKRLLNRKPSAEAYEEARRYTVKTRRVTLDSHALKSVLASEIPVVIGMKLRQAAASRARRNQGVISVPHPAARSVQAIPFHAVVLCGYDDDERYFIMRNSWGDEWVS